MTFVAIAAWFIAIAAILKKILAIAPMVFNLTFESGVR
jgi:hypothetical protein